MQTEAIISIVFGVIVSIIGFFLKNLFSELKDLQREVQALRLENEENKRQIALNSQRDGLVKEFYDKTVGLELRSMEKTLTRLEKSWDTYVEKLMKNL